MIKKIKLLEKLDDRLKDKFEEIITLAKLINCSIDRTESLGIERSVLNYYFNNPSINFRVLFIFNKIELNHLVCTDYITDKYYSSYENKNHLEMLQSCLTIMSRSD